MLGTELVLALEVELRFELESELELELEDDGVVDVVVLTGVLVTDESVEVITGVVFDSVAFDDAEVGVPDMIGFPRFDGGGVDSDEVDVCGVSGDGVITVLAGDCDDVLSGNNKDEDFFSSVEGVAPRKVNWEASARRVSTVNACDFGIILYSTT